MSFLLYLFVRKLRDIQLAVLQKAQLLDISLSSEQYFRFIFVAKAYVSDECDNGKNRCDARTL